MIDLIKTQPLFTKLTIVNLLSKIGDNLFYTAMLTTAATLPQPHLTIMLVTISETLPILFSFLLGNLADRMRQKAAYLLQNACVRALLYGVIGLLFHYQQTIYLLLLMAICNFLSDLLGNYSSALVAPFSKLLVQPEKLETAQSFVTVSSQLVTILANFAGSLLLGVISIATLASTNAVLFLLVAVGYGLLRKKLTAAESQLPLPDSSLSDKKILKTTCRTISELVKKRILFKELMQLALINGFLGGLTPLLMLYLAQHPQQLIGTPAITLSLFSTSAPLFMILGNLMSPRYFRKITTSKLLTLTSFTIVAIALSFLLAHVSLLLLFFASLSFLVGLIMPRFATTVIGNSPAEKLGGIMTTVNSLLVILPPLTGFIFPMIAMFSLSSTYIFLLFYGFALILLGKIA